MDDTAVKPEMEQEVKSIGLLGRIVFFMICALAAFCGLIAGLATDWTFFETNSTFIGRILGRITAWSIISWALFYVIFARGTYKKVLTFGAIFFSIIVGMALGFAGYMSSPKHAEAMRDAVRVVKTIPDVAQANDMSDKVMGELLVLREDFENKLVELDWENILAGERIQNDLDAVGSRMIIDGVKAAMNEYMQKGAQVLDQARTDILAMDISIETRNTMLKIYDNDRAFWDKLSGVELNMILEYEKIVVLFETHKGKWVVENGSLGFEDEKALDGFNQYINNIEALMAEYQEMAQSFEE